MGIIDPSETIYITRQNHHWCVETAIDSLGGKLFELPNYAFFKSSKLRNILALCSTPFYSIKLPKSRVYLAGSAASLLLLNIKKFFFRHKFITIQYVKSDYYNRKNHTGFKRKFMDYLAKIVDGAIVPGKMLKKEIEEKFQFPVSINIHYPHDNSWYKLNSDIKSKKVLKIGIKSHFRKGTDIVNNVAKQIPNSEFYIMGDTKHLPVKFIEELQNQNNIILTGFANPRDYIQKSTFFLMPSKYDAGPIALTEAMAAGLIPIISDTMGGKDLVEELDKSLIINGRDPKDYTIKIKELMDYPPEILQEISNRCKKIASKHTLEKGKEDFRNKFIYLLSLAQKS